MPSGRKDLNLRRLAVEELAAVAVAGWVEQRSTWGAAAVACCLSDLLVRPWGEMGQIARRHHHVNEAFWKLGLCDVVGLKA